MMYSRSEGFPNGIFYPCALWARGLARWKNCRRVVGGVISKNWKIENPGNTGKPIMLIQFWTWKSRCTLGVWTYTGVFWVSELILCCVWTYTLLCLNLYSECLNLYRCTLGVWTYTLLCLNLYFVVSAFPTDADDGDGGDVPTTLPSGQTPSP